MAPRTLTVLAPIRPGEEEALRDVLRPIGDDVKGKRLEPATVGPRIEFRHSRRIHFARFAILDDPDRGRDRKRLLYSANYDGDLDSHLAELIAITTDMDAIWSHLDGYAGTDAFAAFIRAHTQEPEAFYIAFRDETVEHIHDAIAFRRGAQTLVDEASSGSLAALLPRLSSGAPAWATGRSQRSGVAAIERLFRALPIVADLFRAVARCGVGNVFRSAQRITASLGRYPLFRWLNRLTGNRMPPQRSPYSSVWLDNCTVPVPLVPGDEVPSGPDHQIPPTFREDVIAQNQLTLVTVVMPGQVDRVRAVMAAILPALDNPYHAHARLHDLGLNGSYVVYRKLQQDVVGFWEFMKRETIRLKGKEDAAHMVWLAARCVGRWPSGAAPALAPLADDPVLADRNDFLYRDDPFGLACPLGAHVRRTNPRDDIKPYAATESLSMSEAHRLLRRARVFGPTLLDPKALSDAASDASRTTMVAPTDARPARAFIFFCVNANIRSQFEFVQQTWCNNPRFGGLNDNKDPISGDNNRKDEPSSHMTIPAHPLRLRTSALPRFVTVKAGAYLFMPGLRALRFLAGLKD